MTELIGPITERINKVSGDFRQNAITERWNDVCSKNKDKKLLICEMEAKVSAGTYIRSLCDRLGNFLGIFFFIYLLFLYYFCYFFLFLIFHFLLFHFFYFISFLLTFNFIFFIYNFYFYFIFNSITF